MARRLAAPDPADRAAALALTAVSPETEARLDRFVALLLEWGIVNLVASASIPRLWTRHIADSLQLLPLAPQAKTWVDLGSGGGFPGLVVACALAEQPGARIHLVESHSRKAAFLREAARIIALPAMVHNERIERFVTRWDQPVDVVTARALAPLPRLIDYAAPLLQKGAQGLFLKGLDVEAELIEATRSWNITADLIPSVTDPTGRIMVIRALAPRGTQP